MESYNLSTKIQINQFKNGQHLNLIHKHHPHTLRPRVSPAAYVLVFLCKSTQNQTHACYLSTPLARSGCTTPTLPSEIPRASPTSPLPTFLVLVQDT